jgi:hypothetical protein
MLSFQLCNPVERGLVGGSVDLEGEIVTVNRTLTWLKNETGVGRRMIPVFSEPKTEHSRRSIRLPAAAVDAFRRQQQKVLELEQKATVEADAG